MDKIPCHPGNPCFLDFVAAKRKADLWNEKKPRYRKSRDAGDWALAQFRGYWEKDDTSGWVHDDIGKVVGSTLKHLGLKNRFDEEQVLSAWNGIVGEFVAQNSRPVEIRHGNLIIQVLQPTVHYTLERMKGEILERMQARFGKRNVRDIRFRIG